MSGWGYIWDGVEWVSWGGWSLLSFTYDPCWHQYPISILTYHYDKRRVPYIDGWDGLEFA